MYYIYIYTCQLFSEVAPEAEDQGATLGATARIAEPGSPTLLILPNKALGKLCHRSSTLLIPPNKVSDKLCYGSPMLLRPPTKVKAPHAGPPRED